jgi:hypothetical protein
MEKMSGTDEKLFKLDTERTISSHNEKYKCFYINSTIDITGTALHPSRSQGVFVWLRLCDMTDRLLEETPVLRRPGDVTIKKIFVRT